MHSEDQRLLYDPAYKYDPEYAPGQRLRGDLVSGHVQYTSDPRSGMPLVLDLRAGRYVREFLRGELVEQPDYSVGAFTGSRFHFVGEDLARAQTASTDPIPGFAAAGVQLSDAVGRSRLLPSTGSRGDVAWNRFGETRFQLDGTIGAVPASGPVRRRRVRGPAGPHLPARARLSAGRRHRAPPPALSAFSPRSAAAYAEGQLRVEDIAFTRGPALRPVRRRQQPAGRGARAPRARSAPGSPSAPC